MAFILLFALISAGRLTADSPVSRPGDCTDVYDRGSRNNGVYTIYPGGPTKPVQVYCDMGSDEDSVRWTVIQRRRDGSVNFNRGWYKYVSGFGETSREYWLGLENIHDLTHNDKNYELKVDMEDSKGHKACVYYSTFSVCSEHDGYRLTVSGFREGRCGKAAGDSLTEHHDRKFSTFDKDQDEGPGNCAQHFRGGWWFNYCHTSHPNGVYGNSYFGRGITWSTWKGYESSLKSMTMKIRPKP